MSKKSKTKEQRKRLEQFTPPYKRFSHQVEIRIKRGASAPNMAAALLKELPEWCRNNIGAQCQAWDRESNFDERSEEAVLTFYFKSPRDAVLFKLTHC